MLMFFPGLFISDRQDYTLVHTFGYFLLDFLHLEMISFLNISLHLHILFTFDIIDILHLCFFFVKFKSFLIIYRSKYEYLCWYIYLF